MIFSTIVTLISTFLIIITSTPMIYLFFWSVWHHYHHHHHDLQHHRHLDLYLLNHHHLHPNDIPLLLVITIIMDSWSLISSPPWLDLILPIHHHHNHQSSPPSSSPQTSKIIFAQAVASAHTPMVGKKFGLGFTADHSRWNVIKINCKSIEMSQI